MMTGRGFLHDCARTCKSSPARPNRNGLFGFNFRFILHLNYLDLCHTLEFPSELPGSVPTDAASTNQPTNSTRENKGKSEKFSHRKRVRCPTSYRGRMEAEGA